MDYAGHRPAVNGFYASTFYHDGFNAGLLGEPASPPDDYPGTSCRASEYMAGYRDGSEYAEVA